MKNKIDMGNVHRSRIYTEELVKHLPIDEVNEEIRIEKKLIKEAIGNGFPVEAKQHYSNYINLLLGKIKMFAEKMIN